MVGFLAMSSTTAPAAVHPTGQLIHALGRQVAAGEIAWSDAVGQLVAETDLNAQGAALQLGSWQTAPTRYAVHKPARLRAQASPRTPVPPLVFRFPQEVPA
jgi:hypothetical protein